jgi:hypothetical protein
LQAGAPARGPPDMHTRQDETPHPSKRINPLIWNYKPHGNTAHIS